MEQHSEVGSQSEGQTNDLESNGTSNEPLHAGRGNQSGNTEQQSEVDSQSGEQTDDIESNGTCKEQFYTGTGNGSGNTESEVPLKTTNGIVRGDHLVVKQGRHKHHVLVIEDITVPGKKSIKVIEYEHGFFTRKVVKREISVDLEKDLLYRINSHLDMSTKSIERAIMKAELQVGFKNYSHTSVNNCERFVNWCFADTIFWEKITKMSEINKGDHIIDSRTLYWHMIAAEEGSQDKPLLVIQYTSGKVNKTSVSLNINKNMIFRVVYPRNFELEGILDDRNTILRKAESQVGFEEYSPEANNDEHFVNWCISETGHRERVYRMADIKRGDHLIYVGALWINYHYLAIENGTDDSDEICVIQYKINEVIEGRVRLGTKEGNLYRFVDDDQDLVQHNTEEIISQAKRQLNESKYCDYANSNEHFVYWCKTRAEHKLRIRSLNELKHGDHIIIQKYKHLGITHALVVKHGKKEIEIIYYGRDKVLREIVCGDILKEGMFRFYEDAFSSISSTIDKESIIERAKSEIGKRYYSVQANNNIHFVQWCKIKTETIEEVHEIEEIQSGQWFIIQSKGDNSYNVFSSVKKGENNKIYAVTVAYGTIPLDESKAMTVIFNADKERLFRVLCSFEENTVTDNTDSPFRSGFNKVIKNLSTDAKGRRQVFLAEEIKKGDYLAIHSSDDSFFHHCLAVEDGKSDNTVKIIHYCPTAVDFDSSNSTEETIKITSDNAKYYIFDLDNSYDPETAVRRARQMLAHYSPCNCLYFALLSKLPFKPHEVGPSALNRTIHRTMHGISFATTAALAADSAVSRILFSAAAKGLSPVSTTVRVAAATGGIAAGAAVLTESIFVTFEAIRVQGKINQVRNSIPNKKAIYHQRWQMGGSFVGAVGGTVGGGIAGQILIPVPILGFAVGALVGGVVGRVGGMGISAVIGNTTYSPNGIDVYMNFLRQRRASCSVNM